MTEKKFKVGDRVKHARRAFQIGTVIQVEGGADGDLTEVLWPDGDALWHSTSNLLPAVVVGVETEEKR